MQMICPNCHSQTKTFRFKGKQHSQETKEIISKISKSQIGKIKHYWSKENMIKYGIN